MLNLILRCILQVRNTCEHFEFGYCLILVLIATQEPREGPFLGRLVYHGKRNKIHTNFKVIDVHGQPAQYRFARH